MLINTRNLSMLSTGYSTIFNGAFAGYTPRWNKVAMYVSSGPVLTLDYTWLRQLKKMRQWIGERTIDALSEDGYKIKNLPFENTIAVPRENVETDQYHVFNPLIADLGQTAAENPDDNVYGLLRNGFTTECYDGQYFFDTDHSVRDGDGGVRSVSNFMGGGGTPWFLLCTKRQIKPLIFQERVKPRLVSMEDPANPHVFMKNEFVHGVDCSQGFGYGLWQLAIGSAQALNPANYQAARAAMMDMKGDNGRPLGLVPDTLMVPGSLEGDGRAIVSVQTNAAGAGNPWYNTAEIVAEPLLAA